MLVFAVQQSESVIYIYIYPLFPIWVITEYWVEFHVLHSRSLLVIYFIYSSVYMSIPISYNHFLNASLVGSMTGCIIFWLCQSFHGVLPQGCVCPKCFLPSPSDMLSPCPLLSSLAPEFPIYFHEAISRAMIFSSLGETGRLTGAEGRKDSFPQAWIRFQNSALLKLFPLESRASGEGSGCVSQWLLFSSLCQGFKGTPLYFSPVEHGEVPGGNPRKTPSNQ